MTVVVATCSFFACEMCDDLRVGRGGHAGAAASVAKSRISVLLIPISNERGVVKACGVKQFKQTSESLITLSMRENGRFVIRLADLFLIIQLRQFISCIIRGR